MIDKTLLTQTVENAIQGSDLFVVDIKVSPENNITVTVDAPKGVDIEQCVKITREIEAAFDREVEDYELEVGSAGLTTPFTVLKQYQMNIGNPIEILTRDGRKIHATLKAVSDDFSTFTFEMPVKTKVEGSKRPVIVNQEETMNIADAKSVRYELKF
jgi:ribosome maturation factor RimP